MKRSKFNEAQIALRRPRAACAATKWRSRRVTIVISSSHEFDAERANKGLGSIALATHRQTGNRYAA